MRALTPHVGRLRRAALAASGSGCVARRLAAEDGVAPGALAARDGRLLYGAARGALELLEVHPAGKRPMDAAAWLRGDGGRLG